MKNILYKIFEFLKDLFQKISEFLKRRFEGEEKPVEEEKPKL